MTMIAARPFDARREVRARCAWRLRLARERAIDRPFTRNASLRLDVVIARLQAMAEEESA
jgi:hypothetical protein